jgi:hypothetical protein
MMDARSLLLLPHLTIISGERDFDLQRIARIIAHSVTVDGRVELDVVLGRLIAEVERSAQVTPKTLDLVGHTRSSASLLALGGWTIDAADPATTAWFRELADREVLPRLGVHALRLLGCHSAGTPHARATIGALSDLLGLEVYGTNQLLCDAHYDAGGFRDGWSFLLVAARELRRAAAERTTAGGAHPRILDLDALPEVVLGPPACSRRVASAAVALQVVQLVRPREGAPVLGPPATPTCELALPATKPDSYHVAHVVLGGEFLQFYPDGMSAPGIVFPVDDPDALRRIIATLRPGPELSP